MAELGDVYEQGKLPEHCTRRVPPSDRECGQRNDYSMRLATPNGPIDVQACEAHWAMEMTENRENVIEWKPIHRGH